MMKKSYQYGLECEKLVCEHLKKIGYIILHARFKTPHGEIDIIAEDNKTIVFIEVKARSKLNHYEILSPRQIKRVSRAAIFYMAENTRLEQDTRFDYVLMRGDKIISHIKNAWNYIE